MLNLLVVDDEPLILAGLSAISEMRIRHFSMSKRRMTGLRHWKSLNRFSRT